MTKTIKAWDDSLKSLVRADPQGFADWLLPGARVSGERREQLNAVVLEIDTLLEVEVEQEKMLLHVEFQTNYDATMPERVLRYNVLARSEHQLPVRSFVLYLLYDGPIHDSPFIWTAPPDQKVLEFYFTTLQIGHLTVEELRQTGLVNVLPLVPLARDGATREAVSTMLKQLDTNEHAELALVGYKLASLVFKRRNPADLEWLLRSFRQMHDILRESPIYQLILNEGREEGFEEGKAKGKAEGRVEGRAEGKAEALAKNMRAFRDTVLALVNARFPECASLALRKVEALQDVERLQSLVIHIGTATSADDVRQVLLAVEQEEVSGER